MLYRINRISYTLIIYIIGMSLGLLISHISNSDDGKKTQKDYIAVILATQWINAHWNLLHAYDYFEKNDESSAYKSLDAAVTQLYQAQSIGLIYHHIYLNSSNIEHNLYIVDLPGYYIIDINELINKPYNESQKQLLNTIIDDIHIYKNYISYEILSSENPRNIQDSIQKLRLELRSSHVPNYIGK